MVLVANRYRIGKTEKQITLIGVMNPKKAIAAYEQISSYNEEIDCIKIF